MKKANLKQSGITIDETPGKNIFGDPEIFEYVLSRKKYLHIFEEKLKEKSLPEAEEIITYLEATSEESWCTDVVKKKDGRNCLYGHLFDIGGNDLFDAFDMMTSTFVVFPINDGSNERYQQNTPKQRCIAYLKDLFAGKEMTAMECFDRGI